MGALPETGDVPMTYLFQTKEETAGLRLIGRGGSATVYRPGEDCIPERKSDEEIF